MNKKVCTTTVEPIGSRKMAFTISTASVDRDGDTIDPNGWDLRNYMRNPTVLWAHNHTQPPIGKASHVWTDSKGLHATVEFPPVGVYPFADQIHDLVKAGFLNATSVGFVSKASRPSESGQTITRAELLEFSIVSVGSNPDALVMQRAVDRSAMQKWLGESSQSALDWDAIGSPAREDCIDWHNIARSASSQTEVNFSEREVSRVIHGLLPIFREGLRAGLKAKTELAVHAVMCRMTGRLD